MQIIVEELQKTYHIPLRRAGLAPALKSLFRPVYTDTLAVDKVSFGIEEGEIIGFIGPNGAGKTTTLKVLAGLLYPTAGRVRVAGYTPWQRKPEYLRKISLVMGNKSQLTWENTIRDSFEILRDIYNVSSEKYSSVLDELIDLLELAELLPKMARNLSLGERAKCEFAAALLYRPSILFLDEPTLGLDISMQLRLRDFIRQYHRRYQTTIIVTSHYMADIQTLCERVLLINSGRLIYDGRLAALADIVAPYKLIKITAAGDNGDLPEKLPDNLNCPVEIIEKNQRTLLLRIKMEDASHAAADIINQLPAADLTLEDPPIEAVIDRVYRQGVAA